MAYEFPTEGLTVVPTGSIGVMFLKDGNNVPSAVEVRATNSQDVETVFSDLALLTPADQNWQIVELTEPLPFGEVYQVQVYLDGDLAHSETIEIPLPGRKRLWVLRQRFYETLLKGYLQGHIAVEPYGNGHYPTSINKNFKGKAGLMVELGPAYVDGISRPYYDTMAANGTFPMTVWGAMDNAEDAEEVVCGLEEIQSYLMATDWRLSGFNITQSEAVFGGSEPEINEDRKLAKVRGTVTVPVRSRL